MIAECARSAGGARPNRETGPLPHCHPPRLRRLDIPAQKGRRDVAALLEREEAIRSCTPGGVRQAPRGRGCRLEAARCLRGSSLLWARVPEFHGRLACSCCLDAAREPRQRRFFGAIQRRSPRCCACCAAFRVRILACRAFSATLGLKRVEVRAFRAAVVGKSAEPRVLARDGPGFSGERSRFKRGGWISSLPAGCRHRTHARNGGQGPGGRPRGPRTCSRAWSTASGNAVH